MVQSQVDSVTTCRISSLGTSNRDVQQETWRGGVEKKKHTSRIVSVTINMPKGGRAASFCFINGWVVT